MQGGLMEFMNDSTMIHDPFLVVLVVRWYWFTHGTDKYVSSRLTNCLWPPKPMKNEGFRPSKNGSLAPKNEGCGFPCCHLFSQEVTFPPIFAGQDVLAELFSMSEVGMCLAFKGHWGGSWFLCVFFPCVLFASLWFYIIPIKTQFRVQYYFLGNTDWYQSSCHWS